VTEPMTEAGPLVGEIKVQPSEARAQCPGARGEDVILKMAAWGQYV
jgi:hypothetical protein